MPSVKKVCIFGGGSAGWISTLAVSTAFPDFEVTIVLPKKYGNIGVGESTQPNLLDFLVQTGINIPDFIEKVDATPKHGIYYKNWNGEDHYWHPFTDLTHSGFYTPAHEYHQRNLEDPVRFPREKYYEAVHPESYNTCVIRKESDPRLLYALHIDADKMADYIRNFLGNRVRILEPQDIKIQSEGSKISSLILDHQSYEFDLYVDCSGFSRTLIGKLEGIKDDGYEGNVNSALAARIPYKNIREELIPYTQAAATKQGWVWTIPLQSRIGTGFVYNDQFCSQEEAEREFRILLGEERTKDIEFRKISFHSKSLKNPWIGNVVAVGLSSGFVEPLEATGIAWFVTSTQVLISVLQHRYFDDDVSQRFNSSIRQYIEDVQDFVDAHYMLSSRRDSEFWKYQTSRPRTDRLLSRLESYRNFMPDKISRPSIGFWAFNDVSWIDILTGYDFKFNKIKN